MSSLAARVKALGDWTFSPHGAEHVHRDGTRLPLAQMRPVMDQHVDALRGRMQRHARDLAEGRITPEVFEGRMRSDIQALHIHGRLLGAGGRAQMSQSEWGKVGQRLRQEYRYLNGFVRDIEAGRMTPAGIIDRAGKYAGSAAVDQFEEARRGAQKRAGYTEKRRIALNDEGTCSTCRDEAARGWVPIDEPGFRIGHTQCQSRDRCTIEYRREGASTSLPSERAISEVEPEAFVAAMQEAHNAHKAYVSPVSADDLRGAEARCFLAGSGDAGYFMRPDGYLGGLFNGGRVKGVGHDLLLHGVENGAISLDCFSGYLSSRYGEYGFKITKRYPWDDEFAPPGWNYERDNHPDYVDMEWIDGDRKTVRARHRTGLPLQDEE